MRNISGMSGYGDQRRVNDQRESGDKSRFGNQRLSGDSRILVKLVDLVK